MIERIVILNIHNLKVCLLMKPNRRLQMFKTYTFKVLAFISGGYVENYLKRAHLPKTPDDVCKRLYHNANTTIQMCAGERDLGKGTCNVSAKPNVDMMDHLIYLW